MLKGLKRDGRTILIAVIAASLVSAAPATAGALNAHTVDRKHAVGAKASPAKRAKKLVATDARGFLPDNILRKALDADRLDGLDATAFARRATLPFVHQADFTTEGELSNTFKAAAESVIVVPADGTVVADLSALFSAKKDAGRVLVRLLVDGVMRTSTVWDAGDNDSIADLTQSLTTAVPVSKGRHSFRLHLASTDAEYAAYYDPRMTLTYLPTPIQEYTED